MWMTFFLSLIAVFSTTFFQIGSGFVCLSSDRPTPVCLTYKSDHIFSHDGWSNARSFFLDPTHPDCQNTLRQKCCATWKLYYQPPDEWALTEHLGIGYWCKPMNPAEQCLEENPQPPMPYKKSKRYLPVDDKVPEPQNQYDPDCILIAHGNGDNGSPATLPEIHSDGIDDNQPQSQYNNNNNNQFTSEVTAQDDGNNIQASISFAPNDIDTFNMG